MSDTVKILTTGQKTGHGGQMNIVFMASARLVQLPDRFQSCPFRVVRCHALITFPANSSAHISCFVLERAPMIGNKHDSKIHRHAAACQVSSLTRTQFVVGTSFR